MVCLQNARLQVVHYLQYNRKYNRNIQVRVIYKIYLLLLPLLTTIAITTNTTCTTATTPYNNKRRSSYAPSE